MEFFILIGLILLNGVFSMSELAVVSARKARLLALINKGRPGAKTALALQEDPSRFLSTVQIGITLIGIISGAYGATALAADLSPFVLKFFPMAQSRADDIAFGLVIILTTSLSLVLGELVPKRLALLAPETIALVMAPPMSLLARCVYPLVWLLRTATESLLSLMGLKHTRAETVTEEEIHAVIEEGASSGAIDADERLMMRGVMRLADRDVRSIMTPRPEVVWIDADDPVDIALAEMAASGHSRFPLARGTLEHIVGIIQTKDVLAYSARGNAIDLAATARTAIFVPESLSVMRLLEAMQGGEARMALIVDEHGVVQGLVTAADLLGAIAGAGAFSVEDGLDAPMQREDGSWLVDGLISIEDLEILLGTEPFARNSYTSAAGLVMHELERLPQLGDKVTVTGWQFEVIDMDGRRIDKLLVSQVSD